MNDHGHARLCCRPGGIYERPPQRLARSLTAVKREEISRACRRRLQRGEERLSYRGEVLAAVKEGRHKVQQSRLKRAAAGLDTTMVEARTAFL